MDNLNRIILAIEESILAHISNEDVSVTKVSQLTDRLMKLYDYRIKVMDQWPLGLKKKRAPKKDAPEGRVNGPDKY